MSADAVSLIAALNHPLRRRILRRFGDGEGTRASATLLSREFGLPLGNVSYHLQELCRLDVLSLVEVRRVRGAKELLFRSNLEGEDGWFTVALEDSRTVDEARSR